MLCEICKERDVVITLTEIDGNGVRQVRLCEQCASERGVQTSIAAPKPAIGNFLQQVQQQAAVASSADAGRCSFCASTMRDFRQTGRLGCPYCYTAFEQSLRDLLGKVHGNARHTGREYGGAPIASQLLPAASVDRLRERLERAIREEEFELAATLRDQLRELE